MNRIVNNEKLMSNQAQAETSFTYHSVAETGWAAFARLGRVLGTALRQILAQRAVANELYRLDDRMLADIGLARHQIADVARAAQPGQPVDFVGETRRLVLNGIVRPIVAWNQRRQAMTTLSALDDRMLADIGLSRHQIVEHVRGLGYGTVPAPAKPNSLFPASFAAKSVENKSIQELARLSDRELQDIGVARSEIAQVAEMLIARHFRPANINGSPKAA
jgi:uncharacterized protein YjiS (DUF1127 family)